MLNLLWWPILMEFLVTNVDGKLDEQHIDKHHVTGRINDGNYQEMERKAYNGHDDLFGAKMCKAITFYDTAVMIKS
ncbi:unnamed protein product [Onchocerca flexuosa]|uniref:Secreted protein n=1 Tax=Onchocerca flexuosa TaxID=387005 RepID=A0A183I6F7_9BILA|nr:unnamed protein product [Onchocerca flexuosa]